MVDIYNPAGVDVTKTPTATAEWRLGQRAYGSDDQEYMYVLSSGTITQYALVAIDEDFVARAATSTLALTATGPGWAQVAFATDRYGWVAVQGRGILGKMKDATAANAQLYASNSVGVMGTAHSVGGPHPMIAGVRNVALSSGAGAAYEICAINPQFVPSYTATA